MLKKSSRRPLPHGRGSVTRCKNAGVFLSRARRQAVLWIALAAVALAQTASEKPSLDVRRVGARIACQCGCKDSVATCSMLECHFSKPAKEEIAQMQSNGVGDAEIVQAFIKKHGQGVYLAPPNAFGWIVPYAMVVFGLVVIWLFVKKSRQPKPVVEAGPIEIDDPALDKYKAQIEKDLANLE
jgi:cytochrome c-type biogenesis protein CcmH/NrfF